jgi:hypothetical protein
MIMEGDAVVGAAWEGRAKKTCPRMLTNYNLYSKCFYSVEWYDSIYNLIRKVEDIPFPAPNFNALVAQVQLMTNTSGGAFTETVIVYFYDIMDYSIPRIEKIYGYNTAMYLIKGRRNARDRKLVTSQPLNRWGSPQYPFITDAYTALFGVAPLPVPDDVNNGWGVLWTSSNPRKDYGAPKVGETVAPLARAERTYCDGISYTQALGAGDFILGTPIMVTFFGYNSWEIRPYYHRLNTNYSFFSMSQVLVYPVTEVGIPTHRAIYVKPVGIDTVLVNYYDQAKYRLESVSMRKDQVPRIITNITPGIAQVKITKGVRITRSEWNVRTRDMIGASGTNPPYRIKFQLRDLTTNRVGPFSSGTIVPVLNTKFKRIQYMVK